MGASVRVGIFGLAVGETVRGGVRVRVAVEEGCAERVAEAEGLDIAVEVAVTVGLGLDVGSGVAVMARLEVAIAVSAERGTVAAARACAVGRGGVAAAVRPGAQETVRAKPHNERSERMKFVRFRNRVMILFQTKGI